MKKLLRCTVCNSEFDELKNGKCPNCGTSDDYIVLNEEENEDDEDED